MARARSRDLHPSYNLQPRSHLTAIDNSLDVLTEGVKMSTSVALAEWIKRIADDERRRDTVRLKEDEIVARKAGLIRLHGRRLLDELRATATGDVQAFRDEFPGDPTRDVVIAVEGSDGGFVVRKPAPAPVSLTVAPSLDAAALVCHYRFMQTAGLPPREDRVDVMFVDDLTGTLQMKHHGTGQVFASAERLSEFLLVPVLTGRPR